MMALSDYGTLFVKNGKEVIGEEDTIGMFRTNPKSTLGFEVDEKDNKILRTLYVGDWDFHVGFYKNSFIFGRHGINLDKGYNTGFLDEHKKSHYFDCYGVRVKVKEYKNTGRYMMTFQLNGNNYRIYFGYGADTLDTMKALNGYYGIKDNEIKYIKKYIREW